jgi:hypothetical protein
MSLQGLVDATAAALNGGRKMYGPAATATGLPSRAGLQVVKTGLGSSIAATPATWRGAGGGGYRRSGGEAVTALDRVLGADGQVSPRVVQASTESRDGRAAMNTVVSDNRSGVAAIAPSTDTPAGKQALVEHLQTQLGRAKTLLIRSEQRNLLLANMIRGAGGGYRGMPIGGGIPMSAGMPMSGGYASSAAGGLSGLSGLFTPAIRAQRLASPTRGQSAATKGIPALPGLDRPGLANETRIQKYTRRISRAVTAAFPEITEIGGYRQDSMKWHPSGLALDVMIPQWDTPSGKALGDRVVAFVQAHAQQLGVDHAIWRQAQHNPDGAAIPMSDRGGAVANHFNHVHIASIGGGFDGY